MIDFARFQTVTTADVRAGRVQPKVLAGGIVVAAGLQTNALTFAQRQDYSGKQRLSRVEAATIGFRPDEVEAWFAVWERAL